MEPIIRVKGLKQYFPLRDRSGGAKVWLRAVDGVDLEIGENQVFGLVGESGSGKTTVGRAIIRLYKPTAGRIFFRGRDISAAPEGELRRLRDKIQMIYQDPQASLNPRMRVGTIIRRALDIHTGLPRAAKRERVLELLEEMGLLAEHYNRFPHELSGGQQQRLGLCRALMLKPRLLLLDEPFSAVDPITRVGIYRTFQQVQAREGVSTLLVTHDMREAVRLAGYLVILQDGRVLQAGPTGQVLEAPADDYVRSLVTEQL